MSTKTRTAATAHGEVEYSTLACSNCEANMLEEEAIMVGINLYHKECRGAMICEAETLHTSSREALCVHCAESIFGYTPNRRSSARDFVTSDTRGVDIEHIFMVILVGSIGVMIVAAILLAVMGAVL